MGVCMSRLSKECHSLLDPFDTSAVASVTSSLGRVSNEQSRSNQMKQVIGIDIGGTTINLGRFMSDGTCTKFLSITTPQPATPKAVVNAIALPLKQLSQEYHCQAIGIGMPGSTDKTNRIAKIGVNLPHWEDIPLAQWLLGNYWRDE